MVLTGNGSGNLTAGQYIYATDGTSRGDITGFKRAATPATQFTFDPKQHAGVEIIDMR